MKLLPELTNLRPQYKEIPAKPNEILESLGRPHVDSFNYMLEEGIDDMLHRLEPLTFELPNSNRISLRISELDIAPPAVPMSMINVAEKRIFPSECRQKSDSYGGMCTIRLDWELDGVPQLPITREMGRLPIMLRSKACNLADLSPAELIERGEHQDEWGGHFIMRGNEKLIRMLIMTRRNFPIVVSRNAWKERSKDFSTTGVFIRCVRDDQHSTNNVLHYLTNGTAKLMITIRKALQFIPVMLLMKALTDYTDNIIYRKLMAGCEDDQYFKKCVMTMLRELHAENLHNQHDCRQYLGALFRFRLNLYGLPKWFTDEQAGSYLLEQCVLIHLDRPEDKFNTLVYMLHKLFATVQGRCQPESLDTVMMQELMLGGHILQKLLREQCMQTLQYVRMNLLKLRDEPSSPLVTVADVTMALKNVSGFQSVFYNFLSTGNLTRASDIGLMQDSGLVIVAENINRMRYMSHFRAVHRGSFFVTMRTTEARQLLPDAWGFICPVHTPDGAPCGLLNHMTSDCTVSVTQNPEKVRNIETTLVAMGMIPIEHSVPEESSIEPPYTVMLEGRILGKLPRAIASAVVQQLRLLKTADKTIPCTTEIAFVPAREGGQYPGIYMFVGPSRMMRPVKNLASGATELIGTFEQVYLDICVSPEEAYPGLTTHAELSKTAFLSNLAQLIPMPDCNQSPRNMYQCQMGKQTMGTPCHNWALQCNAKFYRLQTPATPLFRPVHYDNIDLDNYAMGTNAIVAVISYTGYDMEDAMIINKSAFERGFAAGTVYKNEFVTIKGDNFFARDPKDATLPVALDNDGLPFQGAELTARTPLYCYFDTNDHRYHVVRYTSSEPAIVDSVKLCAPLEATRSFGGTWRGGSAVNEKQVVITYRIQRNPSVGDKFASRAGQKGICSQKWPAIDLPFTESGMIPDILFNPHGFPSRMTIAMMIETMAGKTAACHGLVHDATPFRFDERNTAIDYFGRLLEASGYNYYGTERMYSGVDGREMRADIFFGIVHYQRLRHMVSDKWQVRSTGPIDQLTHQPNKGRARGGGVRFGEMERDGLISHGASFLLQDRLFHGSDKVTTIVCRKCGTLLGPLDSVTRRMAINSNEFQQTPAACRLCQEEGEIGHVEIPYIFKFLVSQLTSMNINVKLQLSHPDV
ncbi:DNA-directed RNA polymerase I subunit RPA2 [Anopheles bellator]|uniref:DNA-directed RNA polymerase I subunit RPA2 n=1 Tax=Anopheles bellator TaxID=139047 RepID=UPI0026496589|nr:DNA-directed RNA polymerase I subunit RPA2 [Anopheles bellator]